MIAFHISGWMNFIAGMRKIAVSSAAAVSRASAAIEGVEMRPVRG